jgi:O-antigen/teichoic acid export membrane protein
VTLRRNTLVNLLGQIVAVVISLATVPPLLRLVGDARYGVLLLVWVLLGYFSFFDLGVSQATNQRMATLRGADSAERAKLLWTALAMNSGMGLVAALALYAVGWLVLGRFASMDETLRQESLRALPWIALALPVNLVASVLAGALQGREAFAPLTVVSSLGQLLAQCLPLLVAWRWSISLELLIPAALVARGITALLLAAVCRARVPLRGAPRYDGLLGRKLLGYGGWVTVSGVVSPIMASLDRVVIAGISGSEAVTYYGVPQGLAQRLLMLPSSLSAALFPRFASAAPEERDALSDLSVRVLASVMTPAIVLGVFLVGPFLRIWISPAFAAKATLAAQIILVGVWMNGLALVAHSSLQARGRPDLVAKAHVVELPLYIAILAGSLYLWGVPGAAIAWTARVTGDAVALFALAGNSRRVGRLLLLPAALTAVALLAACLTPGSSLASGLLGVGLFAGAGAWSLHRTPWSLLRVARGRTPP